MYRPSYCHCEDFPCCGHGDDDGTTEETDEQIRERVVREMMEDDGDWMVD